MKFIDRVIGTVFPSKSVDADGFSQKESARLQALSNAYFDDANLFPLEDMPANDVARRAGELPLYMPTDNAWLAANEQQLRVAHAGLFGRVDDERFAQAVTHLEQASKA